MTMTATRAPERSILRNPMAVLAVLFAFLLALTYLLFVRTTIGQKVDNAALIGRGVVPEEFVSDAWTILDTISVAGLALATLAIVTIAAVRGRWWQAAAAGAVILGANLTTQVLKHVLLARPDLTTQTIKDFNTFPSGHATVAISVAAALLLVVPARHRAVVAVPTMLYAVAVGVATVTAGWHRPSDAVGAWFVVGIWTAAAAAGLVATGRSTSAKRPGTWGIAAETTLWLGAAGLLFGAVLLGGAWVGLSGTVELPETGPFGLGRRALVHTAAAAAIAGTALVVMGSLVAGMRRFTLEPAHPPRT
jgi:membrane-associated phospholipid phosphatase